MRSNESAIRSYFEARLERMEVVATTETPSGQVVDTGVRPAASANSSLDRDHLER
jgi:hypothetical protein